MAFGRTSIFPSGRNPCCGWIAGVLDMYTSSFLTNSCQNKVYHDILAWHAQLFSKKASRGWQSEKHLQYIKSTRDYQGNRRSEELEAVAFQRCVRQPSYIVQSHFYL